MSVLPFAEQLKVLPTAPFRAEAAARYLATGLPTRRDERWKYTDLALLAERDFAPRGVETLLPAPLLAGGAQYIFANGMFHGDRGTSGLRDIAGTLKALNLGDTAPLKPDSLADLNTALFTDGFALVVPADTHIEQPIEICFAGSAGAAHSRLIVRLGENASATIIERHAGQEGHTATIVSEIELSSGATLHHARLAGAAKDAVMLAIGNVTVGQDATYDAFSLTTGGRLSRHEVRVTLAAPGGTVHLNGAHVLAGDSHADTTTEIRHEAPHCSSREMYRHVMDGNARSVFQGKIFVAEGAQKTDGFQLNQSLMLSPTAEVNAKPELEIYADDVKCTHGATSGRLDAEALFYLRSRGIPLEAARALLIEAFIGSAIDLIARDEIREAFRARAANSLAIGKAT